MINYNRQYENILKEMRARFFNLEVSESFPIDIGNISDVYLSKLRTLNNKQVELEKVIKEFKNLEQFVSETQKGLIALQHNAGDALKACPLLIVRSILEKYRSEHARLNEYRLKVKAESVIEAKIQKIYDIYQEELQVRKEIVKVLDYLVVSVHGGEALTWAEHPIRRVTVGGSGTGKTVHARLSLPYKLRAIKSAIIDGTTHPLQLVIVDADGATKGIVDEYGIPAKHIYEVGYRSVKGYGWQLSDDIECRDDVRLMSEVLLGDFFPDDKDSSAGTHFRTIVRNAIGGAIERRHLMKKPFDLCDIVVELRCHFEEIVHAIDDMQGYERTARSIRIEEQHGGDTEATLHNIISDFETVAVLWRYHLKQGRAFSVRRFCTENAVMILPWAGYAESGGIKKMNGAILQFMIKVLIRERFGQDTPMQTTWIDIDELTNVGGIEEIVSTFTEGRKYGVSSDLQYQDTAKFIEVFNEQKLSSLMNSTTHLAAFRCRGATAKAISEELGNQWVCRRKSISYQQGSNLNRSQARALSESVARMNQESQGRTTTSGTTDTQGFSKGESTQESESIRRGTSKSSTEGDAESFAKTHTESLGISFADAIGVSTTDGVSNTNNRGGSSTKTDGSSKNVTEGDSWQENWSNNRGGGYSFFGIFQDEDTWGDSKGGSSGGSYAEQSGTNQSQARGNTWSDASTKNRSNTDTRTRTNSHNQQSSDARTDTRSRNRSNTTGESSDYTHSQARGKQSSYNESHAVNESTAINVNKSHSETNNKGKTETFTCSVGTSFSFTVTYEYVLEPAIFPHQLANLPTRFEEGTLTGVFLHERTKGDRGRVTIKALDWETEVLPHLPKTRTARMEDVYISREKVDEIYYSARAALKRSLADWYDPE